MSVRLLGALLSKTLLLVIGPPCTKQSCKKWLPVAHKFFIMFVVEKYLNLFVNYKVLCA